MKVIYYQEEKKFTIKNISISNIDRLTKMLRDENLSEMDMGDLRMYKFRITSTRAMIYHDNNIEDEDLEKEAEEGINWHKETVN